MDEWEDVGCEVAVGVGGGRVGGGLVLGIVGGCCGLGGGCGELRWDSGVVCVCICEKSWIDGGSRKWLGHVIQDVK